MNPRRHTEDSNIMTSLVIGVILILIFFLPFAWGSSLLRDAKREQETKAFREEVKQLAQKRETLKQNYDYFNSEQYKDKWQKQHNGLMQPGEKVIIIEEKKEEPVDTSIEDKEILRKEFLLSRPNREQWWIFFMREESL